MSSPKDRVQLNFCIYPTLLSSHPLFSTKRCARVEPPQAMDTGALAIHSKKVPCPWQVIADIGSSRLTSIAKPKSARAPRLPSARRTFIRLRVRSEFPHLR
jgi:hypothetical protein